MTSASTDQPMLPNQLQTDDEIDLRQVAGALGRRWPWIAGGGALGLILSGLYLITTKPVYQGEFRSFSARSNPKAVRPPCYPKTLLWQRWPDWEVQPATTPSPPRCRS